MTTLACDIVTIVLTVIMAVSEKNKADDKKKVHHEPMGEGGIEMSLYGNPQDPNQVAAIQKYESLAPEQKQWLYQAMINTNPAFANYQKIQQIPIMNQIYDQQIMQMNQQQQQQQMAMPMMNPMVPMVDPNAGKEQKSLMVVVPMDAEIGATNTIQSLEGVEVSYVVTEGMPGKPITLKYYV